MNESFTQSAGVISYVFKGMPMNEVPAEILLSTPDRLVVADAEGEQHRFCKVQGDWLLEGESTPGCLLYGTKFLPAV